MPAPSGIRPIVSNTTPLIALTGVGHLHLLPALYGAIYIPIAVYQEFQTGRLRHPSTPDLDSQSWVIVQGISSNPAIPPSLDAGEAEAISLALAIQARLVLLDEKRGRNAARQLGLTVAGSLTVLLEAKIQGLIPLVRPVMDQMIAQGRRIAPDLRQQVLTLAGE